MKKHVCYFSQSHLKGHLNKFLQALMKLLSNPIPKVVILKCLTKRARAGSFSIPEHYPTQCNIKI